MSAAQQRKRAVLTNAQRKAIISAVAAGAPQARMASEYGITVSAVSKICSRKRKYVAAPDEARTTKGALFAEVDEALVLWTRRVRAANIPVSVAIVQEKAKAFAAQLAARLPDDDARKTRLQRFTASTGYVQNWMSRNALSAMRMHGESAGVDTAAAPST
jgi:Tc5 transposase DNA-binding domain